MDRKKSESDRRKREGGKEKVKKVRRVTQKGKKQTRT